VKPVKAAPAMRKMAIEEDDDEEEEVKPAKAAPTGGMRKMAIVEDDDDEEEEEVKPVKAAAAAPTAAKEVEPPSTVMQAEKAAQAKERGTAALRRGEYRTAAEAYHEACKLQPSVHTHFSNLSLALLKFGQPDHAVTAARRCTELEPTFGKGFFRLGQALKSRGDFGEAVEALRTSLKLHQKAHPNGGKEAGKEAAGITKELAACRDAAAKTKEADAAPAVVKPAVAPAASSSASAAPAKPPSPPKRSVDQAQAIAMGKRAASLAPKQVAGSATTLSAFERQFNSVWAKGKSTMLDIDALREVLGQLPTSAAAMGAFVREGLTDELLSGVLLATQAAEEAAGVAAARVAHLSTCKRFDMAWMFVGKDEKAAAHALLSAGAGCAELPATELAAAAKRYGVQL